MPSNLGNHQQQLRRIAANLHAAPPVDNNGHPTVTRQYVYDEDGALVSVAEDTTDTPPPPAA